MNREVKSVNISTVSLKEKVETENSDSSKWKVFASNTTLHGLRHVVRDDYSLCKRVIWLVCLLSAAGFYMYLTFLSMRNYLSLPIKTIITQETPTNGLTFPAVTVCNLNKFMRSKINVADEDEKFDKMGLNISGCRETRKVRGNLTCGQAMLCAFRRFGPALVKGCNATTQQNIIKTLNRSSERLFNEEEFLIKYGHEIRSMFVLYCRFKIYTNCSDEDFVPHLTKEGLCFTFNSGYNKTTLLHTTFEGPDLGLNILLDVQTNESTLAKFSTGFKVIVHDQNTFINPHDGFDILPGTLALVLVKLKKITRLPAPYRTHCQQMHLPEVGSYTKDSCNYQCASNMTLTQCGCRRPGFPGPKTAPICSFQDSGCVEQSRIQINLTECSCSNACSELVYESRVSYSKFPDISATQVLHHYFGERESTSYMNENYVFLQVGFQRLSHEVREDVPSYGAENLFGELGGNMGLFLGCSVLTICEFFDFVWVALMSRIWKRSTEQNPN